jgi:hypothetical protein
LTFAAIQKPNLNWPSLAGPNFFPKYQQTERTYRVIKIAKLIKPWKIRGGLTVEISEFGGLKCEGGHFWLVSPCVPPMRAQRRTNRPPETTLVRLAMRLNEAEISEYSQETRTLTST